jgi:hypothetical protein
MTPCSVTPLRPPETSRFQDFVATLLEREGALVQPLDATCLDVVVPQPLQRALGIPEFCRLGFATAVPAGARRVAMEADWLERFAEVIGERGRWMRRVLSPANPPLTGVERLLEQEIALGNATYRLRGVSAAWTRYLILDFRFSALSDEKRDGLLRFGVNLATGAMLEGVLDRLTPWLAEDAVDTPIPEGAELPPAWERQRLLDLTRQTLRPRVERQLGSFIKGLHRRLARDRDRIFGYYNDLYRDAMRRLASHAADDEEARRREQHRADAIAREYRARLDDLAQKYALRVTAELVQTLELVMPVQRIELVVRRRKGERILQLDWNPLARRLEHPPCEFGHDPERVRLVCDDALHLVSAPGLAPCPGCGKPYCRRCHPLRCAKCGHADAAAS